MRPVTYLTQLQRYDELYDWLLPFIPLNAQGSNLQDVPTWMRDQLLAIGIEPPETALGCIKLMLTQFDMARQKFVNVVEKLPSDYRSILLLGEQLEVGTLNSCEFNGAVITVPDSDPATHIIAFPRGGTDLIFYCCNLLGLYLKGRTAALMSEAFFDLIGYKQSFTERWQRFRKVTCVTTSLQHQWTIPEISLQFATQIHRYAALGVVDVNDFVRKYLPIPCFGDPRRIGHPLELGSCIAEFSDNFLILHECAHLILKKTLREPSDPYEREFAADRMALSLAIQSAKTTYWRIAAFIGALNFLYIAKWIEAVDTYSEFSSVHPNPDSRIQMLCETSFKDSTLDRSTRVIMQRTSEELRKLFNCLWSNSENSRNSHKQRENSLSPLLRLSVVLDKPSIFLDQVPRWLIFGAPRKLCRELAKLRYELENGSALNSGASDVDRKLSVVLAVYQAAESHPNSILATELVDAYEAEKTSQERGHVNEL